VLPVGGDPADVAVQRESVRLAFVAALQHLPPRQRSVLILRDVLRWKADEVAALLGTTTAAVNSALQRARATLAALQAADARPEPDLAEEHVDLLARYLDAFERYDIDAFVALLAEDAVQDMPPFAMWLRSAADIGAWMLGPGIECKGSRLLPVSLNGNPGFAQWRAGGTDGGYRPWSLQALEVSGGRVVRITSFLDTRLFTLFGLPDTPPDR
jgi:RNA polymerase sigma-70 factor (ECF subfamily)